MKTSPRNSRLPAGALLGVAALFSVGCAASGKISDANGRRSPRTTTDTWATETPAADVRLRQDANGTPRASNERTMVTGSFIPQDVKVAGNSADTAEPVRIYGQGDLRRHGGGISTADSLSRIDPAISIAGTR